MERSSDGKPSGCCASLSGDAAGGAADEELLRSIVEEAYVKELVSGDGGRTSPSLTEVLGIPCACPALDVLEVHWDPPREGASAP